MSIWAVLFVDFWMRRQATVCSLLVLTRGLINLQQYAYNWEVLEYDDDERNRAEFVPTHEELSPITGESVTVRLVSC